jgi:hypothetical protein
MVGKIINIVTEQPWLFKSSYEDGTEIFEKVAKALKEMEDQEKKNG